MPLKLDDRTLRVGAIDFGNGLLLRPDAGKTKLVLPSVDLDLDELIIGTRIKPDADDGAVLGQSGLAFSDLFLASGGVINFNAGNATITHAADALTIAATTITITGTTLALGATAVTGTGNITLSGSQVRVPILSSNGTGALGSFGSNGSGIYFISGGGMRLVSSVAATPFDVVEITTAGALAKLPTNTSYAGNLVVSMAHGTFTGAAATSLTGSTQYPANSLILGVNIHVTTAFTTTAGVNIGDAGDPDRWGTGITVTAGGEKTGPDDYTTAAVFYNGAASDVLMADVGANENVAAGLAGYTIYYIQLPDITYTP